MRCSRCRHTWLQDPPESEVPAEPAEGDDLADIFDEEPALPVVPAETRSKQPPPDPVDIAETSTRTAETQPETDAEPATAETDAEADLPPESPAAVSGVQAPARTPEQPPPSEMADRELAQILDEDPVPMLRNISNLGPPAEEDAGPRHPWVKWLVLVLMLAGLALAMIRYETAIVRVWPPAQQLYHWIEQARQLVVGKKFVLRIGDVKSEQVRESGRPVLMVSGTVTNAGKMPAEVPVLLVKLLDEKGATIYQWQVPPARDRLEPGAVMPFSSRLPNPDARGRRLVVTFVN